MCLHFRMGTSEQGEPITGKRILNSAVIYFLIVSNAPVLTTETLGGVKCNDKEGEAVIVTILLDMLKIVRG